MNYYCELKKMRNLVVDRVKAVGDEGVYINDLLRGLLLDCAVSEKAVLQWIEKLEIDGVMNIKKGCCRWKE